MCATAYSRTEESANAEEETPSENALAWIPRTVRCPRCGELAREQMREHIKGDEIAVRYTCLECPWDRVRYYHENEWTSTGKVNPDDSV